MVSELGMHSIWEEDFVTSTVAVDIALSSIPETSSAHTGEVSALDSFGNGEVSALDSFGNS